MRRSKEFRVGEVIDGGNVPRTQTRTASASNTPIRQRTVSQGVKTPTLVFGTPKLTPEAILRQMTLERSTEKGSGDTSKTMPRPSSIPLHTTTTMAKSATQCTSCLDFKFPITTNLLQELNKECRRENRNPTLYRIATPLEISRIPEHLRKLKTIDLDQPGEELNTDIRLPTPPSYYPHKRSKKVKISGKREVYWRWEKPYKSKLPPLPSACRILEDARQAAKIAEDLPFPIIEDKMTKIPSFLDVDDSESESEIEAADLKFEIITEPPTQKTFSSFGVGEPPDICVPKVSKNNIEYHVPRGPRLLIKTKNHEIILKQQNVDASAPTKLFYEDFDDFATTTKCKEVKEIRFVNEGTTTIRIQWLRAPPRPSTQKLLANAPKFLGMGKDVRKHRIPSDIQLSESVDEIKMDKCEISSGPKKTALHLTTSQKVNPALTRTLKILKRTVVSDSAFENLLLLISFRVPRLKRELIRRATRQRTTRSLHPKIKHLYLQLEKQRRVKALCTHVPRQSKKIHSDTCICILSESDSSSSKSEDFLIFPAKQECTCIRPSAPPRPPPSSVEANWGEDTEVTPFQDLLPEDAFCALPWPQFGCTCEGICICEPSPEDFCPCGPYCDCVLPINNPWLAFNRQETFLEPEDSELRCGCVGICTCQVDVDEPCDFSYPSTPPPSSRQNVSTEYPTKDQVCDCGTVCTCLTPLHSDGDLKCTSLNQECLCQGTCNCDPPPEDEDVCKCGPAQSCPCITPTQLRSQTQIVHPEDPCDCHPVCPCLPPGSVIHFGKCSIIAPGTRLPLNKEVTFLPRLPTASGDVYFDPHPHRHRPLAVRHPERTSMEFNGEENQCPEDELPIENSTEKRFSQNQNLSSLNLERLTPLPEPEDGGEDYDTKLWNFEQRAPPTEIQHVQKLRKTGKILYMKPSCREFEFCELPLILLPGQKLQFEITFRPKTPGFYTDTIYLLTHPQLNEHAYAIRLKGIAMNPQTQCESNENVTSLYEPYLETVDVSRLLYDQMHRRQGNEALTAILDDVINFDRNQTSTPHYSCVTSQRIFKIHNPNLYYHPETSETALEITRTLLELLVPKTNIVENPKFCQRNITTLYYELLQPSSTQEYFEDNLKADQVEELLAELNKCTHKLIQPPIFKGVSPKECLRTAATASIYGMFIEAFNGVKQVKDKIENPYRLYVWRKVMRKKLEEVRDSELIERKQRQREAKQKARTLKARTKSDFNETFERNSINDVENVEETWRIIPKVNSENVEVEIQRMNKKSIHDSSLIRAIEIIEVGVKLTLSILDAFHNICEYDQQEFILVPKIPNIISSSSDTTVKVSKILKHE